MDSRKARKSGQGNNYISRKQHERVEGTIECMNARKFDWVTKRDGENCGCNKWLSGVGSPMRVWYGGELLIDRMNS